MLRVEAARSEQCRAALDVMLQDLAPPARKEQIAEMLAAVARGDVSLDGLLIAHAGERTVGAVLFALQPDGCGFVWPPVVAAGIDAALAEAAADELLRMVGRRLDDSGAWLGQALLDPENERDAQRLQRNGFAFLADLTYLRRPLDARLPAEEGKTILCVEPVDPELDPARLAAVIERTYHGSADCPQLNGLRSGLEAVAGHRLTGAPLRDGWLVFRDESGDVGVLLLADQPEQNAWELVYMGVVPEARGRGYGRNIVDEAVRRAANSSRRDLLLAVDERNRYAGTIYEAAGFQFLDRKSVFARRPPEPTADDGLPRPSPLPPTALEDRCRTGNP
jgi:ribosomal protein S18 acetylase RimI-like enzyme